MYACKLARCEYELCNCAGARADIPDLYEDTALKYTERVVARTSDSKKLQLYMKVDEDAYATLYHLITRGTCVQFNCRIYRISGNFCTQIKTCSLLSQIESASI